MSRQKRKHVKQSTDHKVGPGRTRKAASLRSHKAVDRVASLRFRSGALPILLLVLVTLTAYYNAWPNNLTLDDKVFAAAERYSDLNLAGVIQFFTEDLWAAAGGQSGLYRPLLLVSIAMDAYLFGDWAAGYHLTNIFLHLLVSLLVYGFTRHLLLISGGKSPDSSYIAMLAAMVFSVHPIHAEVVNSIFNRSGLLVSVGVVGGLWWFLRNLESSPLKAWGGLSFIYLLVLFCKESAAVLPALAVVMLWLFTAGDWRVHLRRSLPVLGLLIPLGIFLTLRANALDVPNPTDTAGAQEAIQVASASGFKVHFEWLRLLAASVVWFESLKLTLWPTPLMMYHGRADTNQWMAVVVQLVLLGLAIAGFWKKRYGLITGLAFFYISILPASRIIGENTVTPHIAERYIYLPSVGLAIALAFGLRWLAHRINLRAAIVATLISLLILTPLTQARNAQWANDVLLYEHDYREGKKQGNILYFLVGAYLREKNYSGAVKICDKHAEKLKSIAKFSSHCGVAYGQVGRFDDAEQAFFLALDELDEMPGIHQKLASMYLHLGRRSDAREQFELSAATEQNPAFREFRKAFMLIKLYPSDRARMLEAKAHLEKALQIQPQYVQARQWLENLKELLGDE